MPESKQIGENISYYVDADGVLVISIDTKVRGTRSASGKSLVIATTRGNVAIGDAGTLGLNFYRQA